MAPGDPRGDLKGVGRMLLGEPLEATRDRPPREPAASTEREGPRGVSGVGAEAREHGRGPERHDGVGEGLDRHEPDPWPPGLVRLLLPLHAAHDRPVALLVHARPDGAVAYTIGVNPFVEPPLASITPALVALAAAEHRHGPPCLAPDPVPGAENWGGRATVFGSPWNYGSRLRPDEVLAICEEALAPAG
jgi:hypothetical protein